MVGSSFTLGAMGFACLRKSLTAVFRDAVAFLRGLIWSSARANRFSALLLKFD